MNNTVVLYVHGFKSSSRAVKATQTKDYIHDYEVDLSFDAMDLPNTPAEAFADMCSFVEKYLNQGVKVCLIGSSMGGFLSMYLSAKYNLKAVLINPCVYPWNFLEQVKGKQINVYTGDEFEITEKHVEDAKKIAESYELNTKNLALFLQRGDELLDYVDASVLLGRSALVHIEDGGCHQFDHYEFYLPEIIRFLIN